MPSFRNERDLLIYMANVLVGCQQSVMRIEKKMQPELPPEILAALNEQEAAANDLKAAVKANQSQSK